MGYGDKSAKQKAAEKAADAASAADAAREEAEWGEGTKGVNKKKAAAEAARLAKEERRQAAGAQAAEEERGRDVGRIRGDRLHALKANGLQRAREVERALDHHLRILLQR